MSNSIANKSVAEVDVEFDKAAQQKRYQEQARNILNSMPLGLPKPQPKMVALDCVFVSESFSENFVVE